MFAAIPALAQPAVEPDPLRVVLLQQIGGGLPVAIFASDEGVVAMRADGSRSMVIVKQPAAWAWPDARLDVIWFGRVGMTGELWALDLGSPGMEPVQVAVHLPPGIQVGIAHQKKDGKPLEGLSALASEYDGRIDLVLGGRSPFFRHVEGALAAIDPSAGKRAAKACKVIRFTTAGNKLLRALAVRKSRTPAVFTTPKSPDLRVPGVSADACEDREFCGTAEPVPGTAFWRVGVKHSCADACYTTYQLYDPQSKQFVDVAAPTRRSPSPLSDARSIADMWISADGTSALMDGALYRFDQGLVKANVGEAGGWLGGQHYLR